MNDSRIEILDSLRAMAAFSVCLYHFVCTTTGYVSNKFALALFENGKYGVDMFFVISGFVIPYSMYRGNYSLKKIKTFFLKRLSRLEPPYLVSIGLALLVLFLRQMAGLPIDHAALSLKQFAAHFLYLVPFIDDVKWLNQVYWTLAVEFQYYLLMSLVFLGFIHKNSIIRYVLYMIFLAVGFFPYADFVFHWLPLFLLGILLFQHNQNIISRKEFLLFTGITAMVIVVHHSLGAFFFIFFPVLSIFFFKSKKIFLLSQAGKASYSIYLIHPIIGASVVNVLSHKFFLPWQVPMVILVGLLITIVGAFVMYRVVEKPSIKWSSTFKYGEN